MPCTFLSFEKYKQPFRLCWLHPSNMMEMESISSWSLELWLILVFKILTYFCRNSRTQGVFAEYSGVVITCSKVLKVDSRGQMDFSWFGKWLLEIIAALCWFEAESICLVHEKQIIIAGKVIIIFISQFFINIHL